MVGIEKYSKQEVQPTTAVCGNSGFRAFPEKLIVQFKVLYIFAMAW